MAQGRKNKEDRDGKQEQYEFNLGFARIDTLAELLKVCAKKYKKAITERTEESVHSYQEMINTLFTETYIYIEDETEYLREDEKGEQRNLDKDDILHELDDFKQLDTEEEIMDELQKIRSIYLSLREMLKAVNLDIPAEERIGEKEVFTA